MKYMTTVDGETFTIEINQDDEIIVNGEAYAIDFANVGDRALYSLLIDNESFEALVEEREGQWQVLMRGQLYTVGVTDERTQRLAAGMGGAGANTGGSTITAPMPGLVVAIPVEEGQAIEAGDTVVVLESMKMENELKAPTTGTVERISVSVGDSVEQRATLVVIS